MRQSLRVLITGIGAPGAPSIVRCLRANGERDLHLIGVDKNPLAGGRKLVDEFTTIPSAGDSNFIEKLINAAVLYKADVLIPLVTRELEIISENIEVFTKKDISVSVMEHSKLQMVNDKADLLIRLSEDGFDTPKFIIAETADEVEKAIIEMGYPKKAVCIKGAKGNGSRGIRILNPDVSLYDMFFNEKPTSMISTMNFVMSALREKDAIPRMLVMEYLPGEEYGVDALCENGKILYISGRLNFTVSSSIPQGCVIENRPGPISYASKMIETYLLDGNLNFDFKYDAGGQARLIEINPRLSATIASYTSAGINYPYLRVKQLMGEELPKIAIKEGIVMQRRYTETFYDKDGEEINWG